MMCISNKLCFRAHRDHPIIDHVEQVHIKQISQFIKDLIKRNDF